MSTKWRFVRILMAFLGVIAIGVLGYVIIEGWSFFDALYMTITTVSTVGFKEVHPLTTSGQVFTMFLIIAGTGTMLYAVTAIVQYLLEGNLATVWGRRRMRDEIAKLNGHTILCGYGKVGKEVAYVFKDEEKPFIVVELDEKASVQAVSDGYLCINGNATNDETLKEAGLMKARTIVAATGSDADNLYITLSAKSLKPDIFVVARVDNDESASKLKKAGADRTMSPYGIGGRRLAMLAIKPLVVDFIDTAMDSHGQDLILEDIEIVTDSTMSGKTIETAIINTHGAHILVLRKKNGNLLTNPPLETILEVGDELVIMGTQEQLKGMGI